MSVDPKKIVLLALGLAGCSSLSTTETPQEVDAPDKLYAKAQAYFKEGSYNKAYQAFAEVERQHPYSDWSVQAQLMSSYALYQAKKYEEAMEAFRSFITLHPAHEHVVYAYYMLGVCLYEQIPSVERDQGDTALALEAFVEVIQRFPHTPYAKDARFKIDLIQDHLAGKEMDVGRYYLTQKSYVSAINRFKNVVDHYQNTSHITEALYRLVEAYLGTGVIDQAQASAAVLGHNYPGSTWYRDAYALLQQKVSGLVPPQAGGKQGPDKAQETATCLPPVA